MQTLTFNTTIKTAILLSGDRGKSEVIEHFENVSTVKCSELGFYEIMQKTDSETSSSIPVMRLPIANTNMIITK
jgi:hypothetical protein